MKRAVSGASAPVELVEKFVDSTFSKAIISWQKKHGRHALPWQNTRDAYRVWLSEIMLQQTQVAAVIPYYQRFLERFPDVVSLSLASQEEVMSHWSGLGYYSRARNLHRCAQQVVSLYGGVFPKESAVLEDLPGIGRSTAAAISAFSYGTRAAILDGNVKRVFCRVFGVEGFPGAKAVEDRLWQRAVALLPESGIEAYTQGLMDMGATLCTRTRPSCPVCPLADRCVARATGRIGDLPQRKPKKAIPEKHTAMLIITNSQDQVLLEQRPGSGIWGGLLSLPEVADVVSSDADHLQKQDERLSLAIMSFGVPASCERLQPFSHVFTHFKLYISPYRVKLAHKLDLVGQGGHVWYNPNKLSLAPLPAPVKKLLLAVLTKPDLFNGNE